MIRLLIAEVTDRYIQENFLRLKDFFFKEEFLKGNWRFVEITVDAARTNYKYKHNLTFVPKDIVQTSLIGAGALTWNYSLFDSEFLDITTTGACVVRAFVGSYVEGSQS